MIVHHDPVVKHRSAQAPASTGGRRSRQSSSPAAAGGNGSVSGGTHVITESAKSALAQIAASTIHTAAEDAPEAAEVPAVTVTDAQPEAAPERAKRPRKKREPASRSSANERSEKEILLDSVLSALPEPKAPGQGRGRRRVTTAALTGTPVAATPTAEPAAE